MATTDEVNFIGYGLGAGAFFAAAGGINVDNIACDYYTSLISNASFYPEGTFSESTVSEISVLIFTQTDENEGTSTAKFGDFDFYTHA